MHFGIRRFMRVLEMHLAAIVAYNKTASAPLYHSETPQQ